jgi:shikimate dehydrogenase
VYNRTGAKGQELANQLGGTYVAGDGLPAIRADALINTTSVGMAPHVDATPIDPELLPQFQVVMDIVYAPLTTRLLYEAAARGCRTIDGLQMLLHQGAAQFTLWTGQAAPLTVMRQALMTALAAKSS